MWNQKVKAGTTMGYFSVHRHSFLQETLCFICYNIIFLYNSMWIFHPLFFFYHKWSCSQIVLDLKETLEMILSIHGWGNWSFERRPCDADKVRVTQVTEPRSSHGHSIALSTVPSQPHADYCVPVTQIHAVEDFIKEKKLHRYSFLNTFFLVV